MEQVVMTKAERDFEKAACQYRIENIVTLDPKLTSAAWLRLNSNTCKVHYQLLPIILHIGLERALKKSATKVRRGKVSVR